MATPTADDVKELETLMDQATRAYTKDVLSKAIATANRRVEAQKKAKEAAATAAQAAAAASAQQAAGGPAHVTPIAVAQPTTSKKPTKTIKQYAWDQSGKFVKIFVTLAGVGELSKKKIKVEFDNEYVKLAVNDLQGKNYSLRVNTAKPINKDLSAFTVKENRITLKLAKTESGDRWEHLTAEDAKSKFVPKMDMDDGKDPQESIMDMMKKMYDEGDEDMKRTIGEAWSKSKGKQGAM